MCYRLGMKRKADNLNVRLPADLKARAERLSESCGSSLSIMIRMLLQRLIEHAEENGGKIVMPPDFVRYQIDKKDK